MPGAQGARGACGAFQPRFVFLVLSDARARGCCPPAQVKGALDADAVDAGRQALAQARARARALAHEVGSLREDLATSEKRRERASGRLSEAEARAVSAEERARELEYEVKVQRREAEKANEATARGKGEHRRALAGFRETLASVEAQVQARAAAGGAHCRALESMLRALGGVVGAAGGHLPDVRTLFVKPSKSCCTA